MKKTLEKAKEHIDGLKIICLSVFADNKRALHVYEKAGFKKYGELPNGVIRKNELSNHIYMYLNVQ